MVDILADGVEINIENDQWRMFNTTGPNSLLPFFEAMRGDRVIHYKPAFAERRGLPGDILSIEYIKAVIVGFDERRKRWTLGLQILLSDKERPIFASLVHWPSTENPQFAIDSHTAGRVLAEYLGCPLKLFGVKKIAKSGGALNSRATVTGPLVPHDRVDIERESVHSRARDIPLPITLEGIWLGHVGRNTLTLRLPRVEQESGRGEMPAFHQCVIDRNAQTVRLVPPTGLLGAFFGNQQGRFIKFDQIRNIEWRYTIAHESTFKEDTDGLAVDVTQTTHMYEIYLTLQEEGVLLLKVHHLTTSDLRRRRLQVDFGRNTGDRLSDDDANYLDKYREDHRHFEMTRDFAESAAYVIANEVGRKIAKTTIGSEI